MILLTIIFKKLILIYSFVNKLWGIRHLAKPCKLKGQK